MDDLLCFDAAMKFYCDNLVDGGGWALVRRVKQGSLWHPATDNLAGTQPAYGPYGGPTFDATFGRQYSSWITTSTEFLFTTGNADITSPHFGCCSITCQTMSGDQSNWLITTWGQINNNGAAYSDNSPRKIFKSSIRASGVLLSPSVAN